MIILFINKPITIMVEIIHALMHLLNNLNMHLLNSASDLLKNYSSSKEQIQANLLKKITKFEIFQFV